MIEIYCKNNGVRKKYPAGTSLLEIYKDLGLQLKYGVIAARANHKMKDLKFRVYKPKTVEFVGINIPSGMRTYVRSLSFVMYEAIRELYPETSLRIEHPISKGYYCKILDLNRKLTEDDVQAIKEKMSLTILQDIPFEMEVLPAGQAIEIFEKSGAKDKVNLLKSLGAMYTRVYKLGGLYDYYYGSLAPSTGYLRVFDLQLYYDGLLLQVPNRQNPIKVEEFIDQEKLFETFGENTEWNQIMGLRNVGDMNLALKKSHNASMLIKVAEALQEKKISQIADKIYNNKNIKVILVSGPSSSGKTTFSKRLGIQLAVNGLLPIALSLDDYFLPRELTPRDEKGDYDFESLHALDLELFNSDLCKLLDGEEIEIPFFNFETGQREYRGKKIKLKKHNLLVLEGIHALNPDLTKIPNEQKFKVYVSALTTISLDDHNWIPTTDNRLLRRIIRDYKYRGYSAEDTIARWDSVQKGEAKWIFPYQENADAMFNSALIFEFAVIKKYVEPILLDVPQDCEEFSEAHRLLKFLRYFSAIQDNDVPTTSLLREFFGGSSFIY
ncbi:MAG: nucleoside kinase [Prevotellaceae bacterium]|jgi:uridine kinase|nr:nucleoside kinase [Prevotellaceae bacterium]